MKIQLFDEDDLKLIETTIARALVRALRTVMKEGLIAGYRPPAAETFADAQPHSGPADVAPEPPAPVAPNRPAWAQPTTTPAPEGAQGPIMFNMRGGEPQSGHGYRQMHPIAEAITARAPVATPTAEILEQADAATPSGRAKARDMRQFCKSVSEKPQGFITTDEAAKLLAVKPEYQPGYINTWIRDKAIEGVIVCGKRWTPTKGLPGRLMVKKEDVVAREKLRVANSADMARRGAGAWNGKQKQPQQAAAE